MVDVSWLKQYRVHFVLRNKKGTPKYNKLKRSIAIHGITEPLVLVVGKQDGLCRLLNGHHRLAIAEELGYKQIPLDVVEREFIRDRGIKLKGGECTKNAK
jgi:ParB-like chromosome segregation protein Spo0J